MKAEQMYYRYTNEENWTILIAIGEGLPWSLATDAGEEEKADVWRRLWLWSSLQPEWGGVGKEGRTEKKGTQTEQADRRLDKSSKKVKRAFFPSMLSSMTTSKRRQCTESDNDNVFFNVSKCLKCMSWTQVAFRCECVLHAD